MQVLHRIRHCLAVASVAEAFRYARSLLWGALICLGGCSGGAGIDGGTCTAGAVPPGFEGFFHGPDTFNITDMMLGDGGVGRAVIQDCDGVGVQSLVWCSLVNGDVRIGSTEYQAQGDGTLAVVSGAGTSWTPGALCASWPADGGSGSHPCTDPEGFDGGF